MDERQEINKLWKQHAIQMNIVVPYTYLNPVIKNIIRREAKEHNYSVQFIEMQNDDSYWKLLCDVWDRRQDIVLVEHDIIPWPGAILELYNCPMEWCSYTYNMKRGYGIYHAFGCTKFTSKLMDKIPDVWVQVDDTQWNTLDAQLCEYAKQHSLTPHPHRPPVTHLKGLCDE